MMEVDHTKNNYLNRWNVYHFLKRDSGDVSYEDLVKEFKVLIFEGGTEELEEGIIEYNLMAKRNTKHYNEFKTKGDK